MIAQTLIGAGLALAALHSSLRARRRGQRLPSLRLWVPPLLAALLYLTLFPPDSTLRADALTVLAPGASAAQLEALPRGQALVALPGAAAPAHAERVPDLATALRQRPAVSRLRIVGAGLPPRDLPAAATLAREFRPAPARGIVELEAPPRAALGWQWPVRGRTAEAGLRLQLRDPAGHIVDEVLSDAQGRFALSAPLRAAGAVRFELRALAGGADAPLVDQLGLPLIVETGSTLSVSILAGAPQPELKYLRRWAADAGLEVATRIDLSEGLMLQTGEPALDPSALAALDLLVVDERSWAALSGEDKVHIGDAVAQGLGLLLRATGPVAPAVAADWAGLGFTTRPLQAAPRVTLDRALLLRGREPFTLAPLRLDGAELKVLLQGDDGAPVIAWRALGAGRIGLTRLTDGFRLQLAGEAARHGRLWSQTLSTLARAVPASARAPALPQRNWVDERVVLCGLDADAHVRGPDDRTTRLIVGAAGCAAYWPQQPGWHRLQSGGTTARLHVMERNEAQGLRAARDRAATEALPQREHHGGAATLRVPLPRWPFFLPWLALATLLWWRERRPR